MSLERWTVPPYGYVFAAGVERAVPLVDDRVEDVPAFERRLVKGPRTPGCRVELKRPFLVPTSSVTLTMPA